MNAWDTLAAVSTDTSTAWAMINSITGGSGIDYSYLADKMLLFSITPQEVTFDMNTPEITFIITPAEQIFTATPVDIQFGITIPVSIIGA